MTLRVIDLETTGIDPASDAILEIAAIDLVNGGGYANARSTLVFPARQIPPEASAVHHIVDADVLGAPRIREVIDGFDGADVYIAHNASFEQAFLEPLIGPKTWICTRKAAVRIWPDFPSHANQALRYRLGIVSPFSVDRDSIVAHRALGDCLVTGAIFFEILKHAKFADLIQWTKEPIKLSSLTLKKHRGVPLAEVPSDYLEWVCSVHDMDEENKFAAAGELARRKATVRA